MARSASYWDKRMKMMEQSRFDGNVQSYHEIERVYNKQIAEMQKDINAWYARFAKNNEIDLADARKLLDVKELEELKWNVEDYIKYGEENALDPKWLKQLENASARYHISRLEALQLQLQQRAEAVMAGELDVVDERVRDVYSETFYHSAYEIQRGIGVGWDLERLDDRKIDTVISKPWAVDGKNFSQRIWEQRDKLVNTLHQELTQSIIRGEDPERAVKTLAERMEVSKSNARRLIMTESAAIASKAQEDCYKELDVEQYKIVATLDDVTSDICQGLDGQIFKVSEYAVGSTAPPFHVNCRTVTVPYFADDVDSKRAARGADGKTYLVPADTTYKEWRKDFVKGEEPKSPYEAKRIQNDRSQYETYKNIIGELAPNTFEKFQQIKYGDPDAWDELKRQRKSLSRYEIPKDVPMKTVWDLHVAVKEEKYDGFDSSIGVNSKERKSINNLPRSGNSATMLYDGQTYYTHSKIGIGDDVFTKAYVGKLPLINKLENPIYEALKLPNDPDGMDRNCCTEAKFLNHIARVKKPNDEFSLTILSERHVCESCANIIEQFKNDYPNATVNIISSKIGKDPYTMMKDIKHGKK